MQTQCITYSVTTFYFLMFFCFNVFFFGGYVFALARAMNSARNRLALSFDSKSVRSNRITAATRRKCCAGERDLCDGRLSIAAAEGGA